MQLELLKIVAEHAVRRYKIRCVNQMYEYYEDTVCVGYECDAY